MPSCFGGRATSSSAYARDRRVHESGSRGLSAPIRISSPIGDFCVSATGHREPYEARVSSTVLGARGGEIPPRDSTAQAILPHHSDLAGQTPDQPRDSGGTDRLHHDQDRPDGSLRTGYTHLPKGHQGQRRGNGNPQYQGRRIPSRMELYHLTETAPLKR